MDEIGIDDAGKAEISGEKNTHKKIGILTKKISDLESKKAAAKSGDKKDLTDEINNLKTQLSAAVKAGQDELAALRSQHDEQLTGLEYKTNLSGFNFAFPETIDQKIQVDTVLNTIRESMNVDGVKIVRKDGQLALVLAKDGSDYFDKSNNKIDLKSYTEQNLAQNNLLKTSDPEPSGSGNPGQRQTILPGNAGSLNQKSWLSAIDSQIKEQQAQ